MNEHGVRLVLHSFVLADITLDHCPAGAVVFCLCRIFPAKPWCRRRVEFSAMCTALLAWFAGLGGAACDPRSNIPHLPRALFASGAARVSHQVSVSRVSGARQVIRSRSQVHRLSVAWLLGRRKPTAAGSPSCGRWQSAASCAVSIAPRGAPRLQHGSGPSAVRIRPAWEKAATVLRSDPRAVDAAVPPFCANGQVCAVHFAQRLYPGRGA